MTALLALVTLVAIGTPCTNQRAAPSLSAPPMSCLAPGTSVNLTPQIVHADGYDWRQTDAGLWIASDFLGPQGQAGVLTPPPAPPLPNVALSDRQGQGQPAAGTSTTLPAQPSASGNQPSQGQASVSTVSVTPTQVVSEIDRQAQSAGLNPACVEALAWRESGDDPSVSNPSGARGLFGWLPVGGEWSSTPLGRSGLPIAQASVSQQVAMAVWALANGDGGGAWGQADGCRSSSTISRAPRSTESRQETAPTFP